MLLWAVLLPAAACLLYGALLVWATISEDMYPWTDWSAPHAVLHVVNESDRRIAVSWRWADDSDWDPLIESGRDLAGVAPRSEELRQLGPLIPTEYWHNPIPDGYVPPPDYSKWVVMRVETGALESIEQSFTAVLDGHAMVRVSEDQRIFFSTGHESFLGAPVWGPATELTSR